MNGIEYKIAEATDYLGGSSYCTYSIINPVIEEIKKKTKEFFRASFTTLSPSSATEIDEDVFDYNDIEDESDQQLTCKHTCKYIWIVGFS